MADAFLRNRIRRLVPSIFHDLGGEKLELRQWAYKALQSFYVDPLPSFDPDGPLDRRIAQTETIRRWILNTERAIRKEK